MLLGGVLPFLCWGSSADPAHPHVLPHFVFSEPVTHVHIGVTLPHDDTPEAPAGAAHPATLLLALLGVALGAAWHWPPPWDLARGAPRDGPARARDLAARPHTTPARPPRAVHPGLI